MTRLPVPSIPKYEPFSERQTRAAIVHFFALAVTGAVVSWAARSTGRRRPWLNLAAGVGIGALGAAADSAARVLQRRGLEPADSGRTFWLEHQLELRFMVFYWTDTFASIGAAYVLERAGSLWPNAGRWAWASTSLLLPLTVALNAIDTQAAGRASAVRLSLFSPNAGLRNDVALDRDLASLMSQSVQFWLIYVDLDGFKTVNDKRGHDAGNTVIREFGQRLSSIPTAYSYHLHGDEFALLVAGTATDEVVVVARSAADVLNEVGTELAVSLAASFGAAPCRSEGGPVDALRRRADRELYRAKAHRGSAWHSHLAIEDLTVVDLTRRTAGLTPADPDT